jgi:hypothetical protein
MKKLFIFIFIALNYFNSFGQKVFLETFDSKNSINGWKVKNNGIIKHTNHFSYNGITYYKPEKDSFFIFYDTTFNWNYGFNLSKTFKAIPSNDIHFRFSFFSNDSLGDYFTYSYNLFDKNKKSIHYFIAPIYCFKDATNIIGSSDQLPDKNDTLWQKVDSMTITFHYNPMHPYDSFNKMAVIDEIFFSGVYASTIQISKSTFEVYPNPASDVLKFKYESFLKPKKIQLFDYTGRLVIANKGEDELSVENLKSGLYFVTMFFDNGTQATQKVEIK